MEAGWSLLGVVEMIRGECEYSPSVPSPSVHPSPHPPSISMLQRCHFHVGTHIFPAFKFVLTEEEEEEEEDDDGSDGDDGGDDNGDE